MIWNDTNIAVLRILDKAEEPLTTNEISQLLATHYGINMYDDRVRYHLNKLERNEGFSDSRTGLPSLLAYRAGSKGRSITWAITPLGRNELAVMA